MLQTERPAFLVNKWRVSKTPSCWLQRVRDREREKESESKREKQRGV